MAELPSWIQVLLSLGLLVVVPAGIGFLRWPEPQAERLRSQASKLIRFTGPLAAVSFFLTQGWGSGLLAMPWLGACGLISISALIHLARSRSLKPSSLMRIAACCYLSFGAGWLVLSRFGIKPLDFSDVIVELTAVHFHFAGFAAPLIAVSLLDWRDERSRRRVALTAAGLGVVTAMPIIALGTTFSAMLAALGAVILGVSLIVVAVATLVSVSSVRQTAPRWLLTVSSGSVLIGMALAIQYALGQWLGTPALTISLMAKIHGTLNALGFSLCGLLGWNLVNHRVGR